MKTMLKLLTLVKQYIPVIFLAVIFGTLGHLCVVAIPVLGIGNAVNRWFPVYLLALLGLLRGVLHYAEQYCNHFLAFSILAKIREIVFRKLRSLGPAKMEVKDKGNLISLLTSDIELLEVFYAHTISPVCIAFLMTVSMFIFFFHFSWILALTALAFYLIVGVIIPFTVNASAVKLGTEHRREFGQMNSFVLDCIRGLLQSIQYGNGYSRLNQIKSKSDQLTETKRKVSYLDGLTAALSYLFLTLGGLTMLFLSLFLVKGGVIKYEQALICTVAMFTSFGPVIAVSLLGSGLSGTIASGKRIASLLDEEPVVEDVKGMEEITFSGAEAENVTFSYGKEIILDKLSMEFPKNRITGIQGKSGSGKSTLLKLFMHFWQAQTGQVLVSGKSVDQINTSDLRQIESYVTQETVLFHDTIENNIRIAKLDSDRNEIIEACKKAQIHDFISQLPDGYETEVAELGDNFSGGERQRLGLARAFLHGGDFMILDEPTSNLDSYNEHQIMAAVKKEAKKKSVIIVSHRNSTFEFADKVYKLKSKRKS